MAPKPRKIRPVNDEPADPPLASPAAESAAEKVERVALALNDDGSVNFESMRSGTRERLARAYPSIARELGSRDASAALVPDDVLTGLFAAVNALLVGACRWKFGDYARLVALKPDQVRDLKPLTARVLAKHGEIVSDEAMLGAAFLAMVTQNASEMLKLSQAPRTPAVSPADESDEPRILPA